MHSSTAAQRKKPMRALSNLCGPSRKSWRSRSIYRLFRLLRMKNSRRLAAICVANSLSAEWSEPRNIFAGDIFQVVLSQRFESQFDGEPLDFYRCLRFINPSPYMFCLKFGNDFALIGSSPEVHVRLVGDTVEIRPIAGTRTRGAAPAQDEANAAELLADPKERAEHIMLVDLARNDVGRIAEFGTVRVTEMMEIERYSHVMHIVSNVVGRSRAGCNAFDVVRATFPAGTVSGAPKIRAMQIISELENTRRGCYAGAIGYFGFDGNFDSCIALRCAVLKNGKAYFQAGAGIVADSDPQREYEETVNKARAMMKALAIASQMKTV